MFQNIYIFFIDPFLVTTVLRDLQNSLTEYVESVVTLHYA